MSPTLVDVLRWRAENEPDRVAHRFLPDAGGTKPQQTYGQLDARARAIAVALRERCAPGDRAVLLFPAGLDFVEAFFGCLYARVIAVPAYPPRNRGHLPRLHSLLTDSGAKLALTNAKTLAAVRGFTAEDPAWSALGWLATDEVVTGGAEGWTDFARAADDVAFLQYTSGSTGSPRGVMVTHANIVYNTHYIQESFRLHRDSVSVSWLPSFHDMGLIDGVIGPVYTGYLGVLMSPVSFIQRPARWLEAITRFRATHCGGPNFGYDLCVQKIAPEAREGLDLSSWESAYNGAEPVRAATLRAFTEAFAGCGFRAKAHYPCFGMAETTLMVSGCDLAREPVVRRVARAALERGEFSPAGSGAGEGETFELVSSGRMILDTRVAIVDRATLTRAVPGAIGEVWVTGPTICAGYWQRPEATAETFQATLPGEEARWLRTGDLGYLDEAGELFICGRVKDLIIIRGRNHYPQDLEATAERAHAAIRGGGGAAFSIERDGEEVLVLVQELERTALRNANAAEIGAAVAAALAAEHEVQPQAVVLIKTGTVPKTSSGKIQRSTARAQYLAGELEVVGTWEAAASAFEAAKANAVGEVNVSEWLRARIAEKLRCAPAAVDVARPFSAFGLDSATLVGLSGELQTFLGRAVSPTLFYDFPSIAALSGALGAASAAAAGDAERPARRSGPTLDPDDAIAIIGLGLRFPGGANDAESFWRLLRDGLDAIREVPAERFDVEAVYAREPATPGKTNSRHGGFLEAIDRFDAEFFGIAPREAAALDPQQRLLLEVAWHALEHAGIAPGRLAGSDTGVFVGISTQDYARRALAAEDLGRIDAYGGTGNALSAAAGRLAYFFGFHGPALAIDTACSSSLVAVHQACRALRDGECSLALAGGVNVILDPALAVNFSQARMLAPDGRCKPFAAEADGYVRSEGCGLVVLKRLSEARAAGDPVLAVIRGSAVNQDGRSNGLTAPNGPAQERVVRAALARAGVASQAIGYVEAHGTGTALGDPIEANALAAALGEGRTKDAPLWVGSVKSNLGHLEAAAGVASLIKVVLALRHGELPASLHFRTPNPYIAWETLPLNVVAERRPWAVGASGGGGVRRAGVSSFGFTGTNAHVILEEGDAGAKEADGAFAADASERRPYLLALSAKTPGAIEALKENFAAWFEAHPEVSLAEVCAEANASRTDFAQRVAAVGKSPAEMAAALRETKAVASPAAAPGVAFLFTGQGSQFAGMGRALYEREPVFRAALERCAGVLDPLLPVPLVRVMHAAAGTADAAWLDQTQFTQPALFALEWSLAELLSSWGVVPAAVMGHSVGEFVAACVAGVFSVEDGLKLIEARGRLMQALPAGGGMLAVFADEATVRAAIDGHADVAIAAVNAANETVVAGPLAALGALRDAFAAVKIEARSLAVSHAFHSPLMAPMLAEFDRVLATVAFSTPTVPVISNLGVEAEVASAAHWRAHVLGAVRFADGVRALHARGVRHFVELGPRPVLSALGQKAWPVGESATWIPTLRAGRDDWAQVLGAMAELYRSGVAVDLGAVTGSSRKTERGRGADPAAHAASHAGGGRPASGRRRLGLPGYPFQRERHWIERPEAGGRIRVSETARRANPTVGNWTAGASARAMEFGVMFFNGIEVPGADDQYRLLIESARFADAHGFSSVWVPERHYTKFGGLYPNPTVLAAALARETRSVRLMAGSLVAPLHHPLRIAEDWSLIDHLSGGRVGVSFASGWNPDDFAMAPGAYAERHEAVFRTIADVRRLWRGEAIAATSGRGTAMQVRIHPAPLQRELPVWVTAAGNPKTFERAGEIGANLLTHLLDQEPEQLAEKIALYRAARERCGHDPVAGRVSVMVHTFLGANDATVRAQIRGPYCAFLKENIHLLNGLAFSRGRTTDLTKLPPADLDDFVGFVFERFYAQRALFGTPAGCAPLVEKLGAAGVNEIAALLDFGASTDEVLAGLPQLDGLRGQFVGEGKVAGGERNEKRRAVVVGGGPLGPFDELRSGERSLPGILHRLEWRERALAGAVTGEWAGTWLVLDEGNGLGAAVGRELAARGGSVVWVEMGEQFEMRSAERFRVKPVVPEDFVKLIAAVSGELRGAVHLWSLDVGRGGETTEATLVAGQNVGLAGTLHLVQALERAGRVARVWAVTRGAVGGVGEMDTPCAVAQAPVCGLGRVLAVEHPEWWGGLIDLDFEVGAVEGSRAQNPCAHAQSHDDQARTIIAELGAGDAEDQVVFRGGRRWVPRLVAAEAGDAAPLVLRGEATYLITGGLGGLGRRVARWLVERGARRLVLTGLQALPARETWEALPERTEMLTREKIAVVRALEASGATVRCAAVDATDAAGMAKLFTEIDGDGAALAGVMHLAGLPENRIARETVFAEHRGVLGPKTTGAWILHELTRERRLDFFVAFSSISAVWGSRGQPLYAAANYFLDALGHHRRALGLPATIVNWGPWSEGGMVVSAADQAYLARLGLKVTAPAAGVAALEHVLATQQPSQVVASVDWALFKELFASRGRQSLFAELGGSAETLAAATERTEFFRELAALEAGARVVRLRAWLQDEVMRTLRLREEQRPAVERGFFELGMDSLMAIEIKNRLQAALGVALRATVVFNYPHIAALADYLATLLPAPVSGMPAELALEAMSADELAGLIQQTLQNLEETRPASEPLS